MQRVIVTKRSSVLLRKFFRVSVLLMLGGFLGVVTAPAQTTTSLSETVTVTAVVIEKVISPAPPPLPNPVNNNGIPLAPMESGTDSAIFKGLAYPGSTISILKNGLVLNELPSNADGTFEVPVHNIVPGTYTFGLSAKDGNGLKSSSVTYTILIVSGVVTEIKNIVIPPTITTNKVEVKLGDDIVFSGKSIPNGEVSLMLFAKSGITKIVTASSSGAWSYTLNTKGLELGDYNAKVRTKIGTIFSLYSETVLFKVGTSNKLRKETTSLTSTRCDLNNDSRVNLLDFSIMAFWYKRLGFPVKVDLNSDNRVNLTDLSILAYCWTG